MRIAFSTVACPELPIPQLAASARRWGYDAVVLRYVEGERISTTLPAAMRRSVRRAFDASGVAIACLDSSVRVVDPEGPEVGARALAEHVVLAEDLGAPIVRAFVGGRSGMGPDAVALEASRTLAEVLGAGSSSGPLIGLETFEDHATGRSLATVLDLVPDGRLVAIWDMLHPWRSGEHPAETAAAIGARTAVGQVKDATRGADGSWSPVPLGHGEVDVDGVLAAWAKQPALQLLSVEWEVAFFPSIDPADVALPREVGELSRRLRRDPAIP